MRTSRMEAIFKKSTENGSGPVARNIIFKSHETFLRISNLIYRTPAMLTRTDATEVLSSTPLPQKRAWLCEPTNSQSSAALPSALSARSKMDFPARPSASTIPSMLRLSFLTARSAVSTSAHRERRRRISSLSSSLDSCRNSFGCDVGRVSAVGSMLRSLGASTDDAGVSTSLMT